MSKEVQQKIYDHVSAHLLTQGKKAANVVVDSLASMYRASDGCVCAMGSLFPPDLTDNEVYLVEGYAMISILRMAQTVQLPLSIGNGYPHEVCQKIAAYITEQYGPIGFVEQELMDRLQLVHDNSPVETWLAKLDEVGQRYHLNTSVLDPWRKDTDPIPIRRS